MTESRKVVKVFLASPGDLTDERKAAKAVVDEFNALYADEFGYQVELVGWEDTVSIYGRPQAIINRELERCEFFVGLMWKKWGTPPDTTGTYSSGFEEEFETSVQRRLNEGRPEISLLFKEIDPEFLRDPGEDLKRVLAFKEKLIANKTILFESFADIRELEKKFRRCISTYVIELRNREAEAVSVQNQAPNTLGELQPAVEESNIVPETPLSTEGVKFLREFISKTARDADKNQISAVEVARFRLLANIVGISGNDGGSLGVHDANLLFSEGSNFTFGRHELTGLLSCGLEHYSQENTPLWRWVAEMDGFTPPIFPIYSVIGSSAERKVGALAAMRLISVPLSSVPPDDREFYLRVWFGKDSPSTVKAAALSYLGDCGITADLPTITQELDRSDYQTTSAAADAIIRINLRDSREKAIRSLFELQPTTISQYVLAELFENDDTLSTEMLLNGVGHRNSSVRSIIVEILCKRRALPQETAEQLLTDSDAKVRYEALKSLIINGRAFSDVEVEKILVKKSQHSGLGLLSMGLPESGSTYLSHFKLQRLHYCEDKELEAAAVDDLLFNRDPQFILTDRQFKRRGETLRKWVDDQYKEEFSNALIKKAELLGLTAHQVEEIRKLENFLRKGFTRKGLDIICQKAEPCDLGRVRLALQSGYIGYSTIDFEYLRKFGEWEDIQLVIELVGRHDFEKGDATLLTTNEAKYQIAARTLYSLGRTRIAEVLEMPMPSKLLSELIIEIPDKAFRNLIDSSVNLLLRCEDDSVRKSAALKCVKSLPKRRIADLLSGYISGEKFRYYNVVHWLDLGVSAPRGLALHVAKKALNKA